MRSHADTLLHAAELVDGGTGGVYWPTYVANGLRDYDGTKMKKTLDLICKGEDEPPFYASREHRVLILLLAAEVVSEVAKT